MTRPAAALPALALAKLAALALVLGALPGAPVSAAAPQAGSLAAAAQPAPAGPAQPVRIVTDRWGIPHVRASTLDDLYYGWGWVTARDRLWQLEYDRRAARGELWQWLGNAKLHDDGGAQLFELAARAHRIWERDRQQPAVRSALECYAAGVNAYIDECRRGLRPWPREFTRLGKTADPWSPEDTYLMILSQGLVLDFATPELEESDAIARHGRAWVDSCYRFENTLTYRTIPDGAGPPAAAGASNAAGGPAPATAGTRTSPATLAAGDWAERARRALGVWRSPATDDPELRASNVFAVGARRSVSGRPMLANDPHLVLESPDPLHVVHVSLAGGVDAIGAALPGVPVVVSGRNARVAWGITALGADVVDVYADTLSQDGRRVRWNGGWAPVRTAPFSMRLTLPGGFTVPLFGQTRRYTPHGPVLVYDPHHHLALAVRWACDDAAISLARLIGLERSGSAAELTARYLDQVTPGLNVVAADVDGHVRYQAVGRVPLRRFPAARGVLPGDGRHEWSGFIAPAAMPAWEAPATGFVVNSNNLPVRTPGAPDWPRYDWAHDRARRIDTRLAGDPHITLDDLASVQNDVVSLGAQRFVPRLLRDLDSLGVPPRARVRAALDTLRAWDGTVRRDRVAPTLYRAWYGALQRRSHLLGLPGRTMAALDGRAPEALLDEGGHLERPARAVAAALDTALARLEPMLGPSIADWQWGRAHRARFRHPLQGLDPAFEPPLIGADGDNSTVCVGASSLPWTNRFGHGPVFRHVVDLAQPGVSYGIITPGNSGDPGSRHAVDRESDWANHAYVPFLTDWRRIERVKESEQVLAPAAAVAPAH